MQNVEKVMIRHSLSKASINQTITEREECYWR